MSQEIKQPRLTKKGLPDRRSESSKKNLEKGKSIIKEALKQVKQKKVDNRVVYSSDEYSTDEEEIILTEVKNVNKPIVEQLLTHKHSEIIPFTFEKRLEEKIKELNDMYGIKISNIENEVRNHAEQTKLTKAELNAIKLQNQALKKTMTNNFRTQAGVINEEMYLKF